MSTVREPGPPIGIQSGPLYGSGAVLKAPAFVSGFDDFAVMGEPVEQCRDHLGVAEDARPLGKGQIGGEEDRGTLVERADQVKEKLSAGLGERPISEFVEHDEVEPGQAAGGRCCLS